jgi:hypothetical protein
LFLGLLILSGNGNSFDLIKGNDTTFATVYTEFNCVVVQTGNNAADKMIGEENSNEHLFFPAIGKQVKK